MKLALVLLLACLALASALPASTTVKKVKPKACGPECPTTENIICAKGDGLEFAFLNDCILKKSNCENSRNMKEVSKGPCPGKTGIRLF